MRVAIYLNRVSFVLPVNPVERTERSAPHDKRQQRSGQEHPSFATLLQQQMHTLHPSMQQEDFEESGLFDRRA